MPRTSYLIKNGEIVNGLNEKPYQADLLIEDDRIKKIGKVKDKGDYQVIDASKNYVCPGFIDINNHSDTYWTLFEYPGQESLLTQGITSIIGGNCGSSIAPVIGGGAIDSIQKYVDVRKVQVHWASFEEFTDFLKERRLALNFGSLVGHSTIRRAIIGDQIRQLHSNELAILKEILRISIEQGALGFSTGLIYSHAKIASKEEIIELAKVVKDKDAVYATHLREEGSDLIPSVKEALSVAEATGVKLQISHLKACNEKSWPLMNEVLSLIDKARESGLDVNFDVYPYTQTGPVLYTLLPAWSVEGGKKALMQRLRDPAVKNKIIQEMLDSDFDYGKVIIANSSINYALPRYKVSEIAKNQGRSNEEVVIDLILSTDDTITIIYNSLSQENVDKAIIHEKSIIASNGPGYSIEHQNEGGLVHSRSFGSFPKYLHDYSFNDKMISIEKAIEKITSLPAKKYKLIDEIGTLEEGKIADVVVIDPKTTKDKSTIKRPYNYSRGVKELFINGKLVILENKLDTERAGRVLTNK